MLPGDNVVVIYKPLDNASTLLARLLRIRFQHCFIVAPTIGGTLEIRCDDGGYTVHEHAVDFAQSLINLEEQGCILQDATVVDNNVFKCLQPVHSCVNLCKDVIGINNWRIQTPYQLYKYLQRRQDDE